MRYLPKMFIGEGVGLTGSDLRRCQWAKSIASLAPAAWYDPSDLSTLFQDTAMTVPVTADGQQVAVMADKSGNGHHLLQATAAARPIYKSDGTLHWLEGDGVDDILTATVPVSAYPFTIAAAFDPLSTSEGGIAGLHQGFGDYKSLMVNNYLRAQDRTSAAIYQAAASSTGQPPKSVAIASFSGTSCELTTQSYTIAATGLSQSFGTPADFRLFSFRNSNRWAGRIYATAIFDRLLGGEEKGAAMKWLADRSGVTL